jgi:HemY protein
MKKIFIYSFISVVFVVAAVWLSDHQGRLVFEWLDYRFSASFNTFLVLLILFLIIKHFVMIPFSWPSVIRKKMEKHQTDSRQKLFTQILLDIAENNAEHGKKLFHRLKTSFADNETVLLILDSLFSPDEETFRKMEQNPQTKLAGLKGLIDLETEKKNDVQALQYAEQAFALNKRLPWILTTLTELRIKAGDPQKALEILELLKKQKQISPDSYLQKKSSLLLKAGKAKEAFKLTPALPQAAVAYADSVKDEKEKASILQKAFKKNPSFEVYKAYEEVMKDENPLIFLKKVEKMTAENKQDKTALVVLADASLKAKLWGQARRCLETYFSLYPETAQTDLMMAKLERLENKNEELALQWEEKAEKADIADITENQA